LTPSEPLGTDGVVMASRGPQQFPSRLVPLPEVLARIDALARLIEPREVEISAALGRVLAADLVVEASLPETAVALRDGWALKADAVADAGPYAPVALVPPPTLVSVGAPLPPDADAVLPPDAVTMRAGMAEATAAAVPGDGVLAAGADSSPGQIFRRAGERLRAVDVAVLRAAGIPRLVVRAPRLTIITANPFIDAVDDTVAPLLMRMIYHEGGDAAILPGGRDGTATLEPALEQAKHADARVIVGGTGAGRHDASVRTVARLGRIEMHGVGLTPGETAALGSLDARPVLILPGRLDAALAAWLVLGRHLLMRLTGRGRAEPGIRVRLARKITSTVGLAEVVLVRRGDDGVEPIAAGCFPLHALAQANGWLLVPPEREGFPAGATVDMHALP
jgi:molybdopterin molybdotransferase